MIKGIPKVHTEHHEIGKDYQSATSRVHVIGSRVSQCSARLFQGAALESGRQSRTWALETSHAHGHVQLRQRPVRASTQGV